MHVIWCESSVIGNAVEPAAHSGVSVRVMSAVARAVVLLLSLAGLCAWSGEAIAIAKFARTTGTWTTNGNWSSVSCAVAGATTAPTASDDVTICPGVTITMNGNPGAGRSLVINGTATWTQGRTTNVGVGGVAINAGGDIAGTATGVLTSTGGLTINATLTSNTVTIRLQTTATQTISGTGSLARLTVTGAGVTAANTGTLTVRTALAGTGTLANSGTLNIGNTAAITTLTATAVGNTVNYTRAGTQTVKATTYHHLGLDGTSAKTMGATAINGDFTMSGTAATAPTGALTVGGAFIIGSANTFTAGAFTHSVGGNWSNDGTFTAGTGTVTFNGAAAQTLGGTAATTFNNLTINNTSGVALGSSPTVSGTLTLSAGTLAVGGHTLTLNGPAIAGTPGNLSTTSSSSLSFGGTAAGVTVPGSVAALNNLTINNTSGVALGGSPTLGGTLTLSAGTFAVGGNTLTLNGPAIAGTPGNLSTTSSSSLSFGGTAAGVTVPGSVAALNNLTINNTSGVALGGSPTLGGTLTLSSGNVTTGANTLTLAASCVSSISRTGGYVIGNLRLAFPVGDSICTYHVGDSIGYAPITVAMVGAMPGTLTGRSDAGDHADTISSGSGIDAAKSANHYWALIAGTLTTYTSYSADFQFCASPGSCTSSEVDAGASTGNFIVAQKNSGYWSTPTVGARTAYSSQATGITSANGFGEFAVGEANLCFNDAFAGPLGASWSVGSNSGSFTPAVVSGRLRLTDATTTQATWVTLERLVPAAGNKATVEFDHFAYGGIGGGADGMALVFSDASVAPVAGAFGGSLGYAQKSNPGSDCTIVGGCPGFTGGWLGIALDEYGNFSNPTEGRYGGTGFVPDSVSIRGSGTGVAGYRFLNGTATLSPGVDNNNVPPGTVAHRYRVIVDHSDSVHVYVSVERDTTSGGGTAYTTLIAPFDVKDPGYSQSDIPNNFNLSFTGSTGASSNIHEITNLRVCTIAPLAAPSLHHIEIDHGGSACTSGTAPVTIKACADAGCTALYMGSVTVDLTPNAGGALTWVPTEPVTFSGGSVAMTLANTTAGTVTLGGTATSPAAGYATQCFNGATQTCSLVFSACTVDAVEASATSVAGTPIFTKLANTAFNLHAVRTGGGTQNVSAVELVDASSGTCGTYPVLTSTISPTTFTLSAGNPRQVVTFTYNDALPNVRVRMTTTGPVLSCSSDNFAIRPQAFTVTSTEASNPGSGGTPVLRAGTDAFSLTATAVYGATTTSGYTGTPRFNSSLVFTGLAHLGTVAAATFPAATSGVSTGSGFKYDEVGNFNLAQYAVYDDEFAAVDSVKGECIPGFSNTPDANGKYSCQFGSSAAGAFGRFVPDHFTVMGTVGNACAAGAFTYMGQSFTLSPAEVVQARNSANGVTANYAGAYAPGSVSFGAENFDDGVDLGGSLVFTGTGLPLTGTWASGIFTLTGGATAVTFTRPAAPSGPFEQFNMGLAVNDIDVATMPRVAGADFDPGAIGGAATYRSFAGSPLKMRFGRLKLFNAHGSELLKLTVPMETQYWNGSGFVKNGDDNCTQVGAANIGLANYTGNLAAGETVVSTGGAFNAGGGGLTFSKPGATNNGSIDLVVNLGATVTEAPCITLTPDPVTAGANLGYLQSKWCGAAYDKDPTARVTFGVYKGNNEFIFQRENY